MPYFAKATNVVVSIFAKPFYHCNYCFTAINSLIAMTSDSLVTSLVLRSSCSADVMDKLNMPCLEETSAPVRPEYDQGPML
jgi:hypothetical protein